MGTFFPGFNMTQTPTYRQRLEQKLQAYFKPTLLKINDDSAKHAGHAGHNALGETHFTVTIVSTLFEDKSRVARHRLVYEVLAEEIKERIHALSLNTSTPQENNQRL